MERLRLYFCWSGVLIAVFLFGTLFYVAVSQEDDYLSAGTAPQTVVVIDPGHGGEDGGAQANGVLEKDINLLIALRLRKMLETAGYTVVMTRESDISIYDESASTVREKKVSDMKKRAEIVNSSENNVLISIHQNKFTQSQYSGTQIFYSGNNAESAALAESIRSSVTQLLQPDNKRELKKDNGSVFLLKKANTPAVIVECGFLSNEEEAHRLEDEEYQKQMAFAVMCGFLDFENKRNNR